MLRTGVLTALKVTSLYFSLHGDYNVSQEPTVSVFVLKKVVVLSSESLVQHGVVTQKTGMWKYKMLTGEAR
jgi:hypothetical protein